jgi:hypothetical protein
MSSAPSQDRLCDNGLSHLRFVLKGRGFPTKSGAAHFGDVFVLPNLAGRPDAVFLTAILGPDGLMFASRQTSQHRILTLPASHLLRNSRVANRDFAQPAGISISAEKRTEGVSNYRPLWILYQMTEAQCMIGNTNAWA